MPKVAFLKSSLPAPVLGADISVFQRLKLLKIVHGWDVFVIGLLPEVNLPGSLKLLHKFGVAAHYNGGVLRYSINGVSVVVMVGSGLDQFSGASSQDLQSAFNKAFEEIAPDVCLSNLRDLPALQFLTNHSVPSSYFLTENEFASPIDGESAKTWVEYAKKAKQVFVASKFLVNSLKDRWDIDADLLTNVIEIENNARELQAQKEFISIMHPFSHKGIDLFLAIAHACPDRKFLVAGSTGKEYREKKNLIQQFPNVLLLPFQTQPALIYQISRITLIPSFWEEGFSRVMIESLGYGVPVIASNRGGLPEAGGNAAVYLTVPERNSVKSFIDCNPEEWINEIKKLDEPEVYEKRVLSGLNHYAEFVKARDTDLLKLSKYLQNQLAK